MLHLLSTLQSRLCYQALSTKRLCYQALSTKRLNYYRLSKLQWLQYDRVNNNLLCNSFIFYYQISLMQIGSQQSFDKLEEHLKITFRHSHKGKRLYQPTFNERRYLNSRHKGIRFEDFIFPSPTVTSIVNLQFQEEHMPLVHQHQSKKISRKYAQEKDRRNIASSKQSYKIRINKIVKQSGDSIVKNTIQIIPYLKITPKEQHLYDPYTRRRYYNMEKLAFPLKNINRELNYPYRYRNLIGRTIYPEDKYHFSDPQPEGDPRPEGCSSYPRGDCSTRRGGSIHDRATQSNDIRFEKGETSQNGEHPGAIPVQQQKAQQLMIQSKQSGLETVKTLAKCKQQNLLPIPITSDYKRQISSLMPIRKPSGRKDYFVFGMSDRFNSNQNKLQIYRDLLWKVNYSNGLYVHTPENIILNYKFYVAPGNNSNLIASILKRRFWWTQTNKQEDGLNFTWSQLKINSLFQTQEPTENPAQYLVEGNQKQGERCLGGGQEQVLDGNKRIFGRVDYSIWRSHLQRNQKSQLKITQNTYQRRLKMYQKKKITKIQNSLGLRVHNHFQFNYYIGNKKALFYNIERYLSLKREDPFKMLPLTFHITKGTQDPEYIKFVQYFQSIEEQKKLKKNIKNAWIVKPGQNTNRGNGISVCFGLDDVKLRLKGKERNGDGKFRTFIIQKYIENPLLYNKRKFDLRHYMLISCINGCFKGYWYNEGYVRTSSFQFNIKSSKDPTIHLTNDAVQKFAPEYGKYQKANKLTYAQLQKYIQSTYPNNHNTFQNSILPQMKHYATQAIKATYLMLDHGRRKHNFQLFGLDFMIDEEFRPWLIQVNTNPCLQLCCPHLHRIIPAVIQNMFKICLDPLFPPPQSWPNTKKMFFGDNCLNENKFELIFDESSDGQQIQGLLADLQRVNKQMGRIQQDNETFDNQGEAQWQAKE